MATKRAPALDRIDIKILADLQRNGRSTMQELGAKVGLSPRATLERVRRLEAAGTITGYRAIIDIAHLSRPVNVFAEIILTKHAQGTLVEKRLGAMHEVVECWEVTGATDYLARFVCADLAVYEDLTTRLIDDPGLGVSRIVSHVALRPIRRFSGYPESLLSGKRR
jgi:DNA-binding Lrp family transcriptional regulator